MQMERRRAWWCEYENANGLMSKPGVNTLRVEKQNRVMLTKCPALYLLCPCSQVYGHEVMVSSSRLKVSCGTWNHWAKKEREAEEPNCTALHANFGKTERREA